MTAATEPPPRIVTLDILRGVAVMGILAMNIVAYAMPEAAYFNPTVYGGADGIDLAAWVTAFIFIDGKMRGLFSLLFGASMLLIIMRAERKGENPASVHYRRILWLLVFGAAHFYLIWWGDILLHYAMVALVAYLFHGNSVKRLIIYAALLMAIDLLVMLMLSFLFLDTSYQAALPNADPETVRQWASMRAQFGPLAPADLAKDLALYRGDYWTMLQHHLATKGTAPFLFLFIGGFETLGFMLIGMIGVRTGFLTGEWAAARYRLVALGGIATAALGYIALAWIMIRSGFDPATVVAALFGGTVIFRLLMVLGYAALIILLVKKGGWLVSRIAAAGRMAFTNYLGASLLMTGLFYGWGLGFYGRFDRAELYLIVFAMWALMLLWSKPWLDRHLYGPFEWLWRTLARWQPQPMRRA